MLSIDTLRTVSALTGIFSSVSQIVIAATALQGVNAYVAQAEVRAQRLSAIQDRFNDSVKAITPPAPAHVREVDFKVDPNVAAQFGKQRAATLATAEAAKLKANGAADPAAKPIHPKPHRQADRANPKATRADNPAKADVEPVVAQSWGEWGRLFWPAGADPIQIAAGGGDAQAKARASAAAGDDARAKARTVTPLGAK